MAQDSLLSKGYEFADVEEKWLSRWHKQNAFATKMEDGKDAFSIVIPPPNVTGVLHVGHALNNTLQDILVRYHRMCGDNTMWIPGTDHAGIATQNVVERQLATEGKGRHDLGREAFIERVWKWREDKGGTIVNQLKKIGSSCDWERERFTMDEGLSTSVREVFVRLYKEGLIYKGDYIVNWCPRCQTALADDEVEHEDSKGKLYHIRYPFADGSGSVVIATTRPETMPGDTAIAVHPDDERYAHLGEIGIKLPLTDRILPVVFDHHVEKDFGTGALKVTPSHDRNDYEIGIRHGLDLCKVIDEKGMMNDNAGKYAGLDRFECRKQIVEDLREQGYLVEIEDYDHAVGHCYRCKTVIEPTTSLQWFVSVKPLAAKAVDAVRDGQINIYPKTWYNTFYSWMDNIRDWCISRQIWWGHRIPAWSCADCGELIVETEDPTSCPKCGSSKLSQETDVLDTWFSSALWPFSTMGWPENTKELQTFYPTSVLITSFDILFFWVARMMMMGLHLMDEVPFKDVYLHALVRDKHGKKMSKSTGNVIDPLEIMAQYGTDSMRFTLTAFAAQGREIKLDEDRIEGYRHFINKIWNAARFAQMHIGDCDDSIRVAVETPKDLALGHRWILSRTAKLVEGIHRSLRGYLFNEVASLNYQFIWKEFCDWYLEWIKSDLFSDDLVARDQARGCLMVVLETILKTLHPITPFVTEEIWSVLPGERGFLATSAFPEVREEWKDEEAEAEMELLMGIITGIRNIRSEAEVHPSTKINATVICHDSKRADIIRSYTSGISDMTRLEGFTVVAEAEKPADAATYIYNDIEIFVPLAGLVDIEAELEKLSRERKKVEAKLKQINGKLGNAKFLAGAPEAVVAKVTGEKEELDAKLAKIDEASDRLKKLS
ncbi:valine--tRNA ligase [Desulfotalea psychrophila]|uniref:Valine--tRNA ligase n=1 Tax=Desulfotalea psychrophila (strain LSv54 / DSM 12343) TaxID=177439 RepID=SYV_DESPS|nr:valine--tRNA ligase [Desulfotalea psychrophila]Q6AMA0.1 RecName: Full=Valine--tRNA ligase; AltName: Full=Valyl-tRNA synthetase; Short=ValRS [Desulfotalea psychrophila LSv54]CAG36525.1 probable valyl-tRNA synthetase [Desulfotalea psychrophila LSv54]